MSLPIIVGAVKTAFSAIGGMGAGLQAALAVGTTGLNYLSQAGQAKAMEEANAAANERARQYLIADYDALQNTRQQEADAAVEKINQNQIEAAKTAATAQTAASAGGVSGLSVDALLSDIFGQEAAFRDSVNHNLENTGQQIASEARGMRNNLENTMNSRQTPNRPSLLGAGLQAATGVYGAFRDRIKVRGRTT